MSLFAIHYNPYKSEFLTNRQFLETSSIWLRQDFAKMSLGARHIFLTLHIAVMFRWLQWASWRKIGGKRNKQNLIQVSVAMNISVMDERS